MVLESVVDVGHNDYIGPPEVFISSFRVLCLRTVSFGLLNWFKLVYWPFRQSK